MNKEEIRENARKQLHAQSREEIKEKSQKIMKNLLSIPTLKTAHSIAFYIAKPYEVDTNYTIQHLLGKKKIAVPVTNSLIRFVEFTSFEHLIKGKFDVFEPRVRKYIDYTPEVFVIPGITFDEKRSRLGHGKGFYDSFLKDLNAYKIGVCFDFQIVDKIPHEEHDVDMDKIVSEERII